MDEKLKIAGAANEAPAEDKRTKRINRWLGIIQIVKEILTWLKH